MFCYDCHMELNVFCPLQSTVCSVQIGTEVNVFSHLGKVLFMHMKEAMFADERPESESEDEVIVENISNFFNIVIVIVKFSQMDAMAKLCSLNFVN